MYLPREKIVFNSPFKKELENLLEYAEEALIEREPIWSPFISAQIQEEVTSKFNNLNDITYNF